MTIKNFSKNDLLTYENIVDLLESFSPLVKANIIGEKLATYCIINNNSLYLLQNNNTYELSTSKIENQLLCMVSLLFHKSLSQMKKETIDALKCGHPKTFPKMQANGSINGYIPQLVLYLTNDSIKFNYTPGEIHFNNGYIDVLNNEFKERTIEHRVTQYIKRDYITPKAKSFEFWDNIFNKIYPLKSDRELILLLLSVPLSWTATKLQISLFLIGIGSSGKSTVLMAAEKALGPYFKKLSHDSFSNEKNVNKVMNSYSNDQPVLLTWINEMDTKKMDESAYKAFVDGDINTVKLYQDGCFNIEHRSLCIATSQDPPNIRMDSGSKRRITSYTHVSEFVDKKEDVNESKHMYLKDQGIMDIIKNSLPDDLSNAFIKILVDRCSKWMNSKNKNIDFSKSKNFSETKGEITSSNDFIQDFIDANIIITNKEEDKINKVEMRTALLAMFPERKLNQLQVISCFKDRRFKYNYAVRKNNQRGCFIGVKFKDDVDWEDDDEDDYILMSEYDALKAKYEELQAKLNDLENKAEENDKIEIVIEKEKPKSKKIEEEEQIKLIKTVTYKKPKKIDEYSISFADDYKEPNESKKIDEFSFTFNEEEEEENDKPEIDENFFEKLLQMS
jgi:hypothetical protein